MELTAFIHFGINTFTGKEQGDGKEFPVMFNPVALDAEQWVKALKAGGLKSVVLTAKHHDGFCLWPTKTTRHAITASPWKNGKGDVVRELKKACDRNGMRFGIYLSLLDRNISYYGDSPRYNEFFVKQLTELLTEYGKIDEIWLDGTSEIGIDGKRQEYDWELILKTIHKLQPNAVTAFYGDDIRWIGNESARGRGAEWSSVALVPGCYPDAKKRNEEMRLSVFSRDLGGKEIIDRATELFWYPSEVSVSIRPSWFYHERRLKVNLCRNW
ncbi:MAG: alpha-L-fucosidase [Butyricimonas paravirosa]